MPFSFLLVLLELNSRAELEKQIFLIFTFKSRGSKNKNQSACQVPKSRVWLCGVRLVPSSPLQPAKKVYKLYKGGPMGGGP